MRIQLKVVPGACRNEISGWLGDTLKLRVCSPAEAGKANAAVIRLLLTLLAVPRTSLRIVSGTSSSRKILEIDGLDEAGLHERLQAVDH